MIGKTIGMVSRIIASESRRHPRIKYMPMMTSRIAVLPSGRAVIQPLTSVGIEARIRKLLNKIAPIRIVKICAVVFTVSSSDWPTARAVRARLRMPSAKAPTAPIEAASVGEKTPM